MSQPTTASSQRLFRDRRDAGRVLAGLLEHYRHDPDVVVLGLPRGGVPVAYEVARHLDVPLDVFVVRKLGVPGHEEVAMGAIASGGVVVVNDDVVRALQIPPQVIEQVAEQEGDELLRREQAYRVGRPMPAIAGRTVILVDDGLATGSSMRAAVQALRQLRPARIVVAVPAAPRSTCRELTAQVDEVVCAATPAPFYAVGQAYQDFTQTGDDEVRALLRTEAGEPAATDADALRAAATPTEHGVPGEDVLFDLVGEAELVLIGEASYGTHEFYAARAVLTQRLIEEKGFCAVAAEADWPDAYRVNCYVRGRSEDATAEEALRGFEHFPAWMWRNTVLVDFVGWLREHNDRAGGSAAGKAGFYGLDLYSLYRSIHEVIRCLDQVDPAAAQRARARYNCLDHHHGDDSLTAAFGAGESCEQDIVDQLADLHRHRLEYCRRDAAQAEDEVFYAEQNARTVSAAAEYYRAMFHERLSSRNLRDRHMADTLDALRGHLSRRTAGPAKIVVWAHNSHVGDARSTEVAAQGELSLGQLVRERHPGNCRSIGFTTYTGTVTAADDWDGPAERKWVRPALRHSIEELFHQAAEQTAGQEFLLSGSGLPARAAGILRSPRLERAIGVIYRPRTERLSHYLQARVADQFDAVIHIDGTRAVEPLERTARWERGELPATYPFAV